MKEQIEQKLDAAPSDKLEAYKAVQNGMVNVVLAADDLGEKVWQRLCDQRDNASSLLKVYEGSEQFRDAAAEAIRMSLLAGNVTSYLDFAAILEKVPEVREDAWDALAGFKDTKEVLQQLLNHSDGGLNDRAWQELQKFDLNPAYLLDIAEHAPRPYRDNAWELFEATHPPVSAFQHVLEGCDAAYISERLWQYCFNDNRSSDEMCTALTWVPHNREGATQEILKRNPTNRALTVVMQFSPKTCNEAWGRLKQNTPSELDLLTVTQLVRNATIAEEAGQMLDQMRSPEKREFLRRLKA